MVARSLKYPLILTHTLCVTFLLLTVSVSAAMHKCTKDKAVEFAKTLAQNYPTNTTEAIVAWEEALDLNFWKLSDENDGKKGAVKKPKNTGM